MRTTSDSVNEIRKIEELADRNQWLNRIHPLVKLCITVYYMLLVVSFPKYELSGLLSMILYPFFLYTAGNISITDSIRRLKPVLPVVCIAGIFNPFFDHTPVYKLNGLIITGGMISMLTLLLKGVLTVLGAYLLIATTSIQKLCAALRMLHVPKLPVTVILLIYRYLILFVDEIKNTSQAYALRAPGQKGIQFHTWGSFTGLLLLRTLDRAQNIYESMCLRGFHGDFFYGKLTGKIQIQDILYFAGLAGLLTFLRTVPFFTLVGSLAGFS